MQTHSLSLAGSDFPIEARDLDTLSIERLSDESYHLLVDNKAYRCKLEQIDLAAKSLIISVNGRHFPVTVADRFDLIVKQLGYVTSEVNTSRDLFAPMPGLVLDVLVKVGDEVTSGTPLMILEAMKMENLLKADGEGTIAEISVTKGQAVDKRQLLIEIQ